MTFSPTIMVRLIGKYILMSKDLSVKDWRRSTINQEADGGPMPLPSMG